jgi:hypothetical protein
MAPAMTSTGGYRAHQHGPGPERNPGPRAQHRRGGFDERFAVGRRCQCHERTTSVDSGEVT